MQGRGTSVDFTTRDLRQVGHGRIGNVTRFLFGHRQHGADILAVRFDLLCAESSLDITGPAFTVGDAGRHASHDLAVHVARWT